MKENNELSLNYWGFYLLSALMILAGLVKSPMNEIFSGLIKIHYSTGVLITDYFQIAGIGATFVNAGLVTLMFTLISKFVGARITGALTAGIGIVAGFAFFGKNLINVLPLILGNFLYFRFKRLDPANLMHIVCFTTGIAPITSFIALGIGLPLIYSIPLAIFVGLLIGFILMPLSSSMLNFHQGYNIYNVGFTLGVIGLAIVGIFRMFGFEFGAVKLWYEGDDTYPFILITAYCLGLMIYGLVKNPKLEGYGKLLRTSGRLVSDYVVEFSNPVVIFNIGLSGLVSIIYVKLLGGNISGIVLGGIATVMAFAGFGKHPLNIIPIFIGIFVANLFNIYPINGVPALGIGLFGTTVAPIAGKYGFFAGVLAGFLHMGISSNVGIVHGGVNLYNNGFAGGFVAGIMIPIIQAFEKKE